MFILRIILIQYHSKVLITNVICGLTRYNGVLRITMTGNNDKLPPTYVAVEEPGTESCNSDHFRPIPDLLACGEDGYWGWCCLGWLFSLPTSFCMSRKMKENKPWLKYGIPGTLKI